MPAPSTAAIDVRDVGKTYGARAALERLTLRIDSGEVVALLGPNGAGKTTTLRILAGLIAPTSGGGVVAGVPLGGADLQALRGRVGLLTEAPGLWDRLTVRTNLVTYARLYGIAEGRVDALAGELGLSDRLADRAGVLSKGLRQRVALVRALLPDPVVLLLDEPTSGLDPAAARTVRDVVGAARARGVAVLLSTHQLDEAEALADRIAVLQRTLVAFDTPEQLRRRLGAPSTVIVEVEGDATRWRDALAAVTTATAATGSTLEAALRSDRHVPDVVAALVAAGARVREVRQARASLEDAYLALVRRHD
jgi:ABC-2 type transport system ATP-binding protein